MTTKLERMLLENIVTNDFGDAPEHIVWVDCLDCGDHGQFWEGKQISGLVSGLVQKGLVWTDGERCGLTEDGQKFMGTEGV